MKLIDEWIIRQIRQNESLGSCCIFWNSADHIKLEYAKINNNKLIQHSFLVKLDFLQYMTNPTIEAILQDILSTFRKDE